MVKPVRTGWYEWGTPSEGGRIVKYDNAGIYWNSLRWLDYGEIAGEVIPSANATVLLARFGWCLTPCLAGDNDA
jgi:hypothetical protein